LSLGVHDDWRVRCAFTAKLSFIFSQIISVESSAAASTGESKEETPKKAGTTARYTYTLLMLSKDLIPSDIAFLLLMLSLLYLKCFV